MRPFKRDLVLSYRGLGLRKAFLNIPVGRLI